MLFGTNLTRRAQLGLLCVETFVLVVVAQYQDFVKVVRSRFVEGDHYSCVIFCFDIHSQGPA